MSVSPPRQSQRSRRVFLSIDRQPGKGDLHPENIDVSLLDVSDSYVILTLTICGFIGHHLNF
jgi:hypothetical protein